MFSQILTPSGMTLAAAVQCLVFPRLFPDIVESRSHMAIMASVFALNYAVLGVYYMIIYPFLLSPLRHLPGPKTDITIVPRAMTSRDRAPGSLYLDILKSHPKDELLLLNVFRDELLISRPRALADLLVHRSYDFVKPTKISGFLKTVLGDGLIVVEGDHHRFLRKNSQPAFSFRHIKDLYPMMWDKAVRFGEVIGEQAASSSPSHHPSAKEGQGGDGTGTVEINNWASRVTLDIIGSAGLGREFNMLSKSTDPLLQVYEELLEPTREKLLFFVASSLFGLETVGWLPWSMNKTFARIVGSLNDLCQPLMREKRERVEKQRDEHFDVLSLLVRSGNFSDRELTDQVLTYLAAGHETTSSALTWACYLLAKNPDVQQKVRDEVRDAGLSPSSSGGGTGEGEDGDAGGFDKANLATTLESLPYLNGVINETLRLYPTVPITIREAVRDTVLADQPIPKGTRILVSPWAVNRSPGIWGEDAEQFKPERWIDETEDGQSSRPNATGKSGSNYHFLTFLHGPRSCIGQGFAKAELRCLLAAMVGGFEWEMGMREEDVLPGGVITIKPANGMYLKLRPLKGRGE